MTDLNSVIKRMLQAREAYYNSGRPIMSDQEYDALEATIRAIEPDHPILAKVGHEPSGTWINARHKIPMGSLNKVHGKQEFEKWASNLDPLAFPLLLQWKLDGFSISIDYENSKFIRALTRGDGTEGKDISDNVRLMQGFKDILDREEYTGSVRAEIIMPKDLFDKINASLPEEDQYENPRNAAAGISQRLDGMYCKYLKIIAYDLTANFEWEERLKIPSLKKLGFYASEQVMGDTTAIVQAFTKLTALRSTLNYNIDGAVIKINNPAIMKSMGYVSGKPKFQIAWKFDPPGATTTFLQEIWDVGRTGVVTPLACLVPIWIEGSTISKATLHNIAYIQRLGISRGDTVMITKRGDIIPHIEEVLEHKGIPMEIPTRCPSCNSALENDGVRLKCNNDLCPGKVFYRILNWIKVVKIDGLGESLVTVLYDKGRLKRIEDIYSLTQEDISNLKGWGESSAEKILDNINATRTLRVDVFLSALGIPGISTSTAGELIKAFGSIQALLQASQDAVAGIHGFGEVSAGRIVSGLKKHSNEIFDLLKLIAVDVKQETGGKLDGLIFCFTGALSQPRSYFQDLVTKHGGRNLSTVTKDLTYLVCNEDRGSSKSVKAAKLGTKVINEQEFLGMVGGPAEPHAETGVLEYPSLFP